MFPSLSVGVGGDGFNVQVVVKGVGVVFVLCEDTVRLHLYVRVNKENCQDITVLKCEKQ